MNIDNSRGDLINIARGFCEGDCMVISRDDIPKMIDSMIKQVKKNVVLDNVIICDHTYKDLPRSQWFKDTMRCTKCGDEKYH